VPASARTESGLVIGLTTNGNAQLASPLAAGLFRGAISESGSYAEFQDYFSNIITLADAETTGSASVPSGAVIADGVGCPSQTAACLRAVAASTMVAQEPFPLYPFVDGTLLTQTISAAFASGEFNRVPVISGTNRDEFRLFVALDYDFAGNPILNSTEYNAAVTALWGPSLKPFVVALYPFAGYSSGGEALGASGTDGIFSCPARNADQSLSKFVTTYAYESNDENAPPPQSSFGGGVGVSPGRLSCCRTSIPIQRRQFLRNADSTALAQTGAALRCDDPLLDAVREDGRPKLLR